MPILDVTNNPPSFAVNPGNPGILQFYKDGQDPSTGFQVTSEGQFLTGGPAIAAPADQNLLAWSYDPVMVTGGSAMTSGTVYLIRVNLRTAATVTNILATVAVAGATLTAGQSVAGIYSTAGVLLGSTADQSASWTSIGTKTMPIVGGPLTLPAGAYYVALLSVGTTPPQFQRNVSAQPSASILNVGLTAATGRFLTADAAQTALPASTNLGSVGATDSVARWVGLS